MPYLRITSPELDAGRRQAIAARLTEAINSLLFDPRGRLSREELRERTTVHFAPYAPGQLFVGGQTPEARGSLDGLSRGSRCECVKFQAAARWG